MEVLRLYFVMAILALVLGLLIPSINAQVPQPAPAPSNDVQPYGRFGYWVGYIQYSKHCIRLELSVYRIPKDIGIGDEVNGHRIAGKHEMLNTAISLKALSAELVWRTPRHIGWQSHCVDREWGIGDPSQLIRNKIRNKVRKPSVRNV
ncbi:hypothetical protein BUALT_Bualt16G0057800 [Buddleja alternifolia]|uniref:Uncharacterized protein n=1 Tax=Buddleja alternifolia TaxID=168488 RepID=A0AAV6WK84_9LAMI|nr:hypothetical protein BUALT_Bualt16G0057800 [Buddleja alternifolia]